MKIFAWVILAVIGIVIVAMIYYLLVGKIIFHFTLSRKSIHDKILKKQLSKQIEEHKIDLCWWDKVPFKEVSIKSHDGLKIVGHYFDSQSSKTALVVHGFGGDYRQMQQYCKLFYDKNFNVLAIENRAHGNSEGACIGLGWLDRKDVLLWIDFLNGQNPERKIVLFGLSMGGTAVCCAAGEKLPENVVAIISDCAFDNADRQISLLSKRIKLGAGLIKKHLYSYAERLHDFDVLQADAVKQVKNTKCPILFIHGDADLYVPVENLYNLFNATPPQFREKYVVEGAGHCLCYAKAGIFYEKKISDFLKKRTTI